MTATAWDYATGALGFIWFLYGLYQWRKGGTAERAWSRAFAVSMFVYYLACMLGRPVPVVVLGCALGLIGSIFYFFVPEKKGTPFFRTLGAGRYVYWAALLASLGIMAWGADARSGLRYWLGMAAGMLMALATILLAMLYVRHKSSENRGNP